jgi:perosamine synthetase
LIAHSKPWITTDDLEAVVLTLKGEMLAQGEKVALFEREMAEWVGANGGVATSSGTSALLLALHTLGIMPGDEVILPTYVCKSVLDAVIAAGSTPVLADVGFNWVMEPQNVKDRISPKTRAVIVPHMYGIFADIKGFKEFEIPVIEDCAQAIGDKLIDRISADLAVLSFHPTKCLTSGEGGMLVSANEMHIVTARKTRDGLQSSDEKRLLSPMSDIQAALGLSQLRRYPDFLKRRREIAGKYLSELSAVNHKLPNYDAKSNSMFFRLPLKIDGGLMEYQQRFAHKGVHIRKGVDCLLHRILGESDDLYPVSVELFDSTISIPLYPALTNDEVRICLDSLHLLQ